MRHTHTHTHAAKFGTTPRLHIKASAAPALRRKVFFMETCIIVFWIFIFFCLKVPNHTSESGEQYIYIYIIFNIRVYNNAFVVVSLYKTKKTLPAAASRPVTQGDIYACAFGQQPTHVQPAASLDGGGARARVEHGVQPAPYFPDRSRD